MYVALLYLTGGLMLGLVAGCLYEKRRWRRRLHTTLDPLFTDIKQQCLELSALVRLPARLGPVPALDGPPRRSPVPAAPGNVHVLYPLKRQSSSA